MTKLTDYQLLFLQWLEREGRSIRPSVPMATYRSLVNRGLIEYTSHHPYHELTGDGMAALGHARYPHKPGRLIDCPQCEDQPCWCNPETDAPCASRECVQQEGG